MEILKSCIEENQASRMFGLLTETRMLLQVTKDFTVSYVNKDLTELKWQALAKVAAKRWREEQEDRASQQEIKWRK